MGSPVHLEPRNSLTPAQELIWTSQRLQPDSPHQNMALLTRFGGAIEPARFLGAVDAVISHSDALRTRIRAIDGVPHPVVASEPPSACAHERVASADLGSWIREHLREPLDLSVAAYESILLELDDGWAWWMNAHHIVIDAASSANVFRAAAAAYHGETWNIPNYAEVWAELSATHKPERVQKARDAWAMAPAAKPTVLYQPAAGETSLAQRTWVNMSEPRQRALDDLLAGEFRLLSPDLSLNVALATALASYLARLGNAEVTIGIPVHHRSNPQAKEVVGPLVELFPLRVAVTDDDTFRSIHKRVARDFMSLLSTALPGTSPRQGFDVVLNVHGATLGDFGSIPATTTWVHPGHIDPHHKLRVQALDYDGSGTLELALDINHATAAGDHRERAAGHLGALLDAMLADPSQLVHSVGLVGHDEALLLGSFTSPGAGVPLDGVAPEVVGQRLRAHGERLAIRWQSDAGTVELTSEVVEQRIGDIAATLRSAGVDVGDLIGIEMPIGIDAVLAIHGVLRSGAAFVPIDPAYPEARREHIRQDSGCAVVLRSLADLDSLPVVEPEPAPVSIDPDDLAYVIYTSGSTGLPKGVPISHRGLSEYLGFAYTTYVGTHAPVMPLFTSLSFDLTITTLFLPFLAGGVMTIHPAGGLPALREIIDERVATLIKATPSHFELLARMIDQEHPLTGMIAGGEAFMTDLADRLLSAGAPGLRIWNEYGPTEAVVGCMEHLYDPETDHGPEVPIGRAAPGVGLHVLDRWGFPVPLGMAGELYISRPGMTGGYLGRPDLNAQRFFLHPETGNETRLYQTGDLVRTLDADRMVYLGRIDEQLKVGGIRLEPGEIEHVARSVEGVERAVVGLWSAPVATAVQHCVRCGLGSDVPDTVIDGDGVCSRCHDYDLIAPQAAAWFKDEEALADEIALARQHSSGDYDVVHLISGGKDSTYALYKLVEMGARVFAITLDNGFIADVAKANVRRATQALGVDHEFVTVDGMNEIFRDSLERFSNVCNGCYKAIYTIALAKAEELGIARIVTGLSRGQFFETRLVPEMFASDRFDPDAIDAMVREARHVYHSTPDAVSEHMDVEFLSDPTIFDRIEFIDFYRYVDVPLAELYESLEGSGTWQRPPDSGRSTNCLINAAGIFVHRSEQGHHNYAAPYSWDVRLGHKTREEALFELDDPMDEAELSAITSMLAEVGYEPRKPEVLTLWVEAEAGTGATPLDREALHAALIDQLPTHAVPQAIEVVETIPLSANGKVDIAALPAPAFRRRAETSGESRNPLGDTEEGIAAIWKATLGLAEIGATEDFFALGGTSLHALEMIVRVSDGFGVLVPESVAFTKRTVEQLAQYIDSQRVDNGLPATTADDFSIPELADGEWPLSPGEESMLYEWHRDPSDVRYNVARLYTVPSDIDIERFDAAVAAVVAHQPTLHTSYGGRRAPLSVEAALRVGEAHSDSASIDHLASRLNEVPFDLVNGPLVSVHHLTSGHVDDSDVRAVMLRTHHIVTDAGSLDIFWNQIDLAYRGEELPLLETTYAAHADWQRRRAPEPAQAWAPAESPAELMVRGDGPTDIDGYLHHVSALTAADLRSGPGTTLFANALAALGAALRPFHSGDAVELTVTSTVRDHPALQNVVGYHLNPLPLVLDVQHDNDLMSLAGSVSETLAAALQFRSVPFGALVRSARARGIAGPTARIMLAVEDLAPAALDGQEVHHRILASGTSVNDLTFFVQIREDRVELGVEYRGSTIGRVVAQQMLDAFAHSVELLAASPSTAVGSCARPPEPMFGGWLAEESSALTPDRLSEVIEQHRDAIAVRCGDASLTYAQADAEARAIAARLRAVGVGAGDRVAIVMPRSVEMIPAIWSCWLLGASYVPIDHGQPAARVTALLSAAEVSAALSIREGHPGLTEVVTVFIDTPDMAVLPISQRHPVAALDEAYVIFTSGSTGEPKGVSIRHGNLAVSNGARSQWYAEPVQSFLLISSLGFDSSVVGLFWTLTSGGEVTVAAEDEVHDVDALLSRIHTHGITHTLMVPTLWGAVLERASGVPETLASLRVAIVAGEACAPALVGHHFATTEDISLVNEYGPTEATVWSTAHRCSEVDAGGSIVPIGAPIPGLHAEVVEVGGTHAVPLHVAGELVVSGPGVAAGYIRADDDSPFVSRNGRRGYRTGDLVVRRDDTIEFLGRVDAQLSVGGVRVEPAEVEQAIAGIAGVHASLVDVRDGVLVGWVESSLTGAEVREAAALVLPATHLPKRILVAQLPRSANGKVDRTQVGSLADVAVATAVSSAIKQGDDPTVDRIAEVFSAVFEGVEVGANDDFFDLGGDSLHAVALVSHLEREFGHRVAIGTLIEASTPLLLADRVGPAGAQEHDPTGWSDSANDAPHKDEHAPSVDDRAVAATDSDDHKDADVDLVEWLRSTGSQTPLIVLPPGGGNLLRYAPLVRALDADVPVVGVRLPGADGRSVIVHTIERQAEAMLRALDAAGVSGPYRLLGWSTGGLLAWEIAQRLLRRGDVVEMVGMVDTVMAGIRVDDEQTVLQKYSGLLRDGGVAAIADEGSRRVRERASFALARRRYRHAAEGDIEPTAEDAERQLGPVIRRAALTYRPSVLDVPVLYCAASESDDDVTVDPWAKLQYLRGFRAVELDGVHFLPEERCIIGPNRVDRLVEVLTDFLAERAHGTE